ncbi:DUF86 domain-containing protein [Candidatus Poribacteria bacterium]
MKRDHRLYLDDILEAIGKIERYTEGLNIDQFRDDDKTFDAVIRNFEIIGEAVKHIPPDIREKAPDIPWKAMAGMRDKLIHEYFGVRFDVVWDTIRKRFPEVKLLVTAILKQMDEGVGKE